jgi:hypothetical protein
VTPPKGRKSAIAGRLVGYARVTTYEQGAHPQFDEFRALPPDRYGQVSV